MTYSDVYSRFCQDKYQFFANPPVDIDALRSNYSIKYDFLAENYELIEHEFSQLFQVLQNTKSKQREFWLYAYYCTEMLLQYYKGYRDTAKINQYNELQAKLLPYCKENSSSSKSASPSFLDNLKSQLSQDIKQLVATPLHVHSAREMIGFLNICRLYWTFCRMTITNALKLARDAHWIERLNQLLSKQINIDKIIKILEAPNAVLRGFSIGFFVARFILNAAMVLKHTFLPSPDEKTITKTQRFRREIAKRHATMLNDMVWGTVNTFTNYAPVFHIAAPVALSVTAGFLMFDVALLLWRRHLEKRNYLLKKSQYQADLSYYIEQLANARTEGQKAFLNKMVVLTREQDKELDINWQAQNSFWLFNAVAALMFFSGFTASLLFSSGILVVASFAVCMIAASMYLTAGSFKQYQEKDLRLTQVRVDNADCSVALAEYTLARNQFFLTITKQVVVPGVLIASWFICWQAALALTALYISYEVYNAWSKHQQQADIAQKTLLIEDGQAVACSS